MSDATASAPAPVEVEVQAAAPVEDKPRPAISNLKALAAAAKAAQAVETKTDKDHELHLLTTLAKHIASTAEEQAVPAAERGYGWVKCYECRLPGLETLTLEGGEKVQRPKNPPETTHWSGPGQDPSTGGAPIVLLLQGPRGSDGKVRPWRLPGGKTAVTLAQEILDEHGADIKLDCRFNSMTKTIDVTAIWIDADWQSFLAKRAQFSRRQGRPDERRRDDRPREERRRDDRPREERPREERPREERPREERRRDDRPREERRRDDRPREERRRDDRPREERPREERRRDDRPSEEREERQDREERPPNAPQRINRRVRIPTSAAAPEAPKL
jgi:hypothetical protein